MSERQTGNAWKWIVGIVAALVLITGACFIGGLWGGIFGYAMGANTARGRMHEYYYEPPFREEGPMPQPYPEPPRPADPPVPFPEPYRGEATAWLGVFYQMTEDGAYIEDVVPESPADDAGLRHGDVIVAVDERAVTFENPLVAHIMRYNPGDRVMLTVLRGAREYEINVRLGERNQQMREEGYPFLLPPNEF